MLAETEQLSELDAGVIQTFVDGARLLGLPKSVGEIYGLLYLAEEPMSMEQIVNSLQISMGSASQGLKQLRVFKAVHPIYVPGERKEYYRAEAELRKLIAGYLREEIYPHLEQTRDRLEAMESMLPDEDTESAEHYRNRYQALKRWHAKSASWLKRMYQFINP